MTDSLTNSLTEAALFELLSLEYSVHSDGSVRYHNALGQMHREYGPAVDRPDGYRAWCQNGLLHRVEGPAIESPDGYRAWWQNGKPHRVDGPAVERPDGGCDWYINGKRLPEAEWGLAARQWKDRYD